MESSSGGKYLVEFADGGVGKIFHKMPDTVVVFDGDCLERGGAYREDLEDDNCESLECVACRCSFEDQPFVGDTTWDREDSTLTIKTPSSTDKFRLLRQ